MKFSLYFFYFHSHIVNQKKKKQTKSSYCLGKEKNKNTFIISFIIYALVSPFHRVIIRHSMSSEKILFYYMIFIIYCIKMNIAWMKEIMTGLLLKLIKIPIWQMALHFHKTLKKFFRNKPKLLIMIFIVFFLSMLLKMSKNWKRKNQKSKSKQIKQIKQYECQSSEQQAEEDSLYPKQQNKTRDGTDFQVQKLPQENDIERKRDEIFFSVIKKYREEDFLEDVSYRGGSQEQSDYFPQHEFISVHQTQHSNVAEDDEDYWGHPNQKSRSRLNEKI